MRGSATHLTSSCTCLNSAVPAAPSSSNSAVSTLVTTAPARSILCSPSSRFSVGPRGHGVARDVHLDAAVEQVVTVCATHT